MRAKCSSPWCSTTPSKDHWRQPGKTACGRVPTCPTGCRLDVFRLALFTNALDEATDFTEYVEFAQRAGFLQEAISVFDQGVSLGLIGTSDAQKKQRAKLAHDLEQDRKELCGRRGCGKRRSRRFCTVQSGA